MLGGFGGKKKEEKEEDGDKGEEEENGDEKPEGEDGEGGDDEGEEEVQQVAKTRKINREQFFKEVRDRSEPPSRGDTEKERDHWSRPRRWQVRLWQVRIENMTDEAILVFANFIFGGTKEEFLVRAGGKEPSIWVAGDEGVVLRTPVVHDVPGDGEDTECDFDVSFEWHGSYLDLERQTLRVEIWNWARWRINKFDCFAEEPLLTFAKGPIQNEMECNKVDKFGKKQCRVQVAFKMFFQEIYDFELTMPVWRASAVPSCKRVLERLRDGIDEEEDEEQTMAGGRGTMARSTRAATQMQRAMSVTSDDLTQQSICIQTPSLLSQGTRSCYLRAKKSGNCGGSLMWDRWDRKRFRGYFRGTCSDLSNASLEVRLDSYERARDLKELLGGSKPGGSRYHMPLANAELPLRGVLEHGEVKASLRPAPWFFSLADGGRAHRQRCGLLQGHVAVENRPRYQQTDDVSDELDLRKRYLFVKVIKVDRVVTPDTRPTDEIDTFVEVTFDGVAKRTRICQDDVSPSFNDDLVFELALAKTSSSNEMQEDTEATWEELERKGPVFIDLWTVGSKSNEHLGSVEAFLQDVLVDEAGQPQKEVSRSARDARLKKQETFSVRAFRGQKRLKFTWGPGQESNIFYEMWFLPDLSPLAVLRPLRAEVPMPKVLADCYEEKTEEWDALADELNGVKEDMERIQKEKLRSTGRQFPSQAKSIWPVETTQEYWLPRFLDVLRPPHGVDSATAVCHYVGCFPYMESKAEDTVSAPNFFCALRKGKILEHCLLHCSLLLGLSCKAYVCGGRTLKGEPHFWVAVFEEDGTVRFWEPFLGTGSMALRRRFAFPQFLIPGKHAPRSLRDVELLRERRRRRRMLRSKGQLLLPAGRSAPKSEAPKAKAKVKKSMFRPAEQEDPHEGHEHDMVYVDILDLGLRERPTEDRGETGRRCATCNALPGGQYFSRGFNCEVCEKAGGSFMLCFSCADPLFKDEDQLQAADNEIREPFDLVKERFDFDAYNELRGPDDSNFVLPYKSVEVIFNNANIWMNLQDEDPRFIFWDLASKDYWQPFVPKVAGLRPCFSSCRFPMAGRDEGWCQQQRRELLQEMRKEIQARRSHKNLGTRWVTSPHLLRFLEAGLRIRAELDMEGHVIFDDSEPAGEDTGSKQELRQKLNQWDRTLEAKTPRDYKLSGMPMHFNFLDADEIAEKVMDLCPFLLTRDKSSQFAVACHLVPLPGEVVSIYLYVCELHALGQMQLKEEIELLEAPKQDQGATVAQLMKQIGRPKPEEKKGNALATMMIKAAKMAKETDVVAVEAIEAPIEAESGPSFRPKRAEAKASSDAPEVMTGFASSFHSRFVRISADGLEASYVGTKEEESYELHGGVIGNGPLAAGPEGKYFELELTRAGEGHPDGLCVGVTQSRPQELRSPPDTMDGVRSTWIAGYDGLMWDPKEGDMVSTPWNPSSLQNGDAVGVLVRPEGHFVVLVNGEVVLERDAQVPFASPLFAVVDLLGSADAVRLRPDQRQPAVAAALAKQDAPGDAVPARDETLSNAVEVTAPATQTMPTMSGFCSKKKGHCVRLSEDLLSASYTGQTGHEMHGGLIGNHPLAVQPGNVVFFAVELTKIRENMMDGLTVGITTNSPGDLDEMPDTIDGVQACWTAGYDGQIYDAPQDRWTDLAWHGRDLRVGDRLGVLVEAGRMKIFVNKELAATAHENIPERPLYALVDLIGSAEGVRLLLDEQPPAERGSKGVSAPRPSEVVLKPVMEGWCRSRLGRMVEVSEDGLTAKYSSSYALHGGLIGDGPLRAFEDCWFFAVSVDVTRPGLQDGLAIGVTTCPPEKLAELPQTMDEVEPCWLLGFDGVEWDGAQLTWGPASWSPALLKVGDLLGVVVTFQGELQVTVNALPVAQASFALPTTRPLYAVVDLIGATAGISLRPEAEPPPIGSLSAASLVFSPPELRDDPFNAPSEAGDLVAPEDVEFEESNSPSTQDVSRPNEPRTAPAGQAVLAPAEVVVAMEGSVELPAEESASQVSPKEPLREPERNDAVEAVLAARDLAMKKGPGSRVPEPARSQLTVPSTASTGAGATASAVATASAGSSGAHTPQPALSQLTVPSAGSAGAAGVGSAANGRGAQAERSQLAVPSAGGVAASAGASTPGGRTGPKRKPVKGKVRKGASPNASASAKIEGFHRSKHGKYVTVSADGLSARHSAPDMEMFGGVLGTSPLRQEAYGFYFEVRVEAVTTGMPDGLAVGVTSDDPALLGEVPEILDGLRQAWLIGFDGVMFDSHDFIEVDWYPSELRIGDRVGVLVAPSGQLSVYVNGKKRVDGPKNVDTSKPLFPAVDLIGNTDGVTLLLEARCPVRPEKQDSKMDFRASAVKARGFHRASLGRSLRLSKDAWTVERLGAEELQGTAIGAAPLELLESGRYFEVHIDEVVPDQPDGMAIGVTSHRPEELLEPVGSSDALRPAWLVGFDGAVWDGAKMEWLLSSWDTRQLSAGDTVGALVDLGNVLRIFVNGQQVAKGPTLPPEKTAPQALLFPVVDLLGAVRRLSLKPMAQAPQELPEPEVLAPPEPVQQQVMSGFYREKVGAQLQLEASDGSARRAAGGLEGGVLLGDAPLEPRQDGAVGYSLVITSAAAAGDKEGIALGVTTRPPKELSALPATADEVDPSFLLGFDGAAWDGSALKWHFSEWQPHTLQASDRVDVLMERGRLQVAVNGYRVAAQQMQVSNSKVPFYALLDISSAGLGVSLQLPVKTPSLA